MARYSLEVVGAESDEATVPWREMESFELPAVGERGEVATRAVLPDAEGVVAFIRNNPNLDGNPWTVFLSEQTTGGTTLI